jgi:hypothetical protein
MNKQECRHDPQLQPNSIMWERQKNGMYYARCIVCDGLWHQYGVQMIKIERSWWGSVWSSLWRFTKRVLVSKKAL